MPTKTAIAQHEVLVGIMKALDENRHSNDGVKLTTKHAILSVVVSAHNSSSRRDVAKAFGVHHRNILGALSRHIIIDDSGLALWSLFVRRKRTDGLPNLLREAFINQWTSEPHANPNKSDATCKRLEAMVYDEKPMHFLMETQVWIFKHLFCFHL